MKFPSGVVKGISEGVKIFFNFRGGGRGEVLHHLLTKMSEGVVNKFPRGVNNLPKISEGVYRNGTTSTGISEGLEKNRKFPRGFEIK